jgi:glycosyltransferase involved in cell wall biosynthesis
MASLSVLLDSRLAVRGLGIATFTDRLEDALAQQSIDARRWQASGPWGRRSQLGTLGRSGLFDLSPRLDPRTRSFDVVHYVSNIGSLAPGPASVVTVHDLLYRRSRRLRDRASGLLLERALTRTGRVVAVSGATAAAITESWPSLQGRVGVIPHGMRKLPQPTGARTHVLAFGGARDPRKRVDLMVATYRAYRGQARDPLPLVVLARAGLTEEQRRDLEALDVRILEHATHEEVDRLVAQAAAVIYPTTTEGFGLPILEAAEVGTPVVMDRAAQVAEEVVGCHCVLVDGTDPMTWARAVERAVEGGPIADALSLPDWADVAARYVALYREVAG